MGFIDGRPIWTGIACMTAGASLYTAVDAIVKWLVADYPIAEVVFLRSLFSILFLLPFVLRQWPVAALSNQPSLQLLRGCLGLTASFAFFVAFRELSLSLVVVIGFAAPLAMAILSGPLLGEAVSGRRWIALMTGFAGVVIAVKPALGAEPLGIAAAVAGTVLFAGAMILSRRLGRTDKSLTTVFWSTLVSVGGAGILVPGVWTPPPLFDLGLFAAAGMLAGIGNLLITQAVRLAPVATVAPFDYVQIPFAAFLGWFIWSETIALHTLIGAAIIVFCGLYIVGEERRKSRSPRSKNILNISNNYD